MKILFETSFEVCNLIGGIHRVVSSKVSYIKNYFDRVIYLGPWLDSEQKEFIQAKADEVPKEIQDVFDLLSKRGISATYGWWDIAGKPEVVLIKYSNFRDSNLLSELKTSYWDKFQIDSLNSRWDFEEPLLFSTFAGVFIEEFIKLNDSDSYFAQFHEWMSGFGALYLNSFSDVSSKVNLVYTTHATLLGRILFSKGVDIYDLPKNFDFLEESKKQGIVEKHSTELACSKYINNFTTVSSITQKEANLLYGVKPKITNNGLDLNSLRFMDNIFRKKFSSRDLLKKSVSSYFPDLNLDEYLFVFSSGRPEFHNKGFDSILGALKKAQDSNLKVIFFFLVPWSYGSLLPNLNYISTHELYLEKENKIFQFSKELGLDNSSSTKVVLYPVYLGSADDILFENKDYLDTISGFDLALFPSKYEPWGYTPVEALSVGVPAVSSNISGFGDYCIKKDLDLKVVDVGDYDSEVKQIFSLLKLFSSFDKNKLFVESLNSISISKYFSWDAFIKQYTKLYFKKTKK